MSRHVLTAWRRDSGTAAKSSRTRPTQEGQPAPVSDAVRNPLLPSQRAALTVTTAAAGSRSCSMSSWGVFTALSWQDLPIMRCITTCAPRHNASGAKAQDCSQARRTFRPPKERRRAGRASRHNRPACQASFWHHSIKSSLGSRTSHPPQHSTGRTLGAFSG